MSLPADNGPTEHRSLCAGVFHLMKIEPTDRDLLPSFLAFAEFEGVSVARIRGFAHGEQAWELSEEERRWFARLSFPRPAPFRDEGQGLFFQVRFFRPAEEGGGDEDPLMQHEIIQAAWPRLWGKYLSKRQMISELRWWIGTLGFDHPLAMAVVEYELTKVGSEVSITSILFAIYGQKFEEDLRTHVGYKMATWFGAGLYYSDMVYLWLFGDRDLGQVLPILQEIVGDQGLDPLYRFFVIEVLRRFAMDDDRKHDFIAIKRSGDVAQSRGVVVRVLRDAIRDRSALNVWAAYSALEETGEALPLLLESEVGGDAALSVRQSPEFGIERYVHADGSDRLGQTQYFVSLMGLYQLDALKYVPIRNALPIHSLADYNPDRWRRSAIARQYAENLKDIVDEEGGEREDVFARFFGSGDPWERPRLLSLADGRLYLVQGHHRIAALLMAAAEGIIPRAWLEEVPFVVTTDDFNHPLIVKKILTLGVDLSWPDLFPAGGVRERVQALLKPPHEVKGPPRSGGGNVRAGGGYFGGVIEVADGPSSESDATVAPDDVIAVDTTMDVLGWGPEMPVSTVAGSAGAIQIFTPVVP